MPIYRKKPVIIEAILWDETKETLELLKSMGMNVMRCRGTDDMGVAFAEDTWLYFEGTITADDPTIRVGFRVNGAGAGNNDAVFYVDQGHVSENYIHNLRIETLEGTMNVDMGDWIIKGAAGDFTPCKPDIFQKTYEQRIDV